MRRFSHLKKVLVGSAFAGAFFFAAPAANAQDLPQIDTVQVVNQVREELGAWGVQTAPVDAPAGDAFHNAVAQANKALADARANAEAAVAQATKATAENAAQQNVQTAAQQAVQNAVGNAVKTAAHAAGVNPYAEEPATNPNPIGLQEQLEGATQPEFKPQVTDPNYRWKNDLFSKVMAGKPTAEYVVHRVPGSYFDAPRIPVESNTALTHGTSLYGPGTPLYIGDDTMCTLAAAGYDNEGRKVGITAGHCGQAGERVASGDSWQVGPTGTVAYTDDTLDYSVIEFGSNAEVSRSYNGVTASQFGGTVRPLENTCKRGVATGTTCGVAWTANELIQISQVCAMVGDSGAPVFSRGRIVGVISGGITPGGVDVPCHTPLQGGIHVPTVTTNSDAIVESMNRRGEVGAGFHLPAN